MRRFLVLFLLIAVTTCFHIPKALAEETQKPEEPRATGNASLGVYNRYIFRGYEIGKSGLVIQPSLTAAYRDFAVTFWGNLDTNQRDTKTAAFNNQFQKGWNETDITLSYMYSIKKLSLTGGYIYYGTKYADETEELFLTGTYDTISKPTLSVYRDINSYKGTYINLSFSHSFPLSKIVALDVGASFGYFIGDSDYWRTYRESTGDYTGGKYQGFHDGMLKAGLSINATKAFVIQPVVQYWFPLSSNAGREYSAAPGADIKDSYNPNGPVNHNFVYGIGFIYSF